MSRVEDFRRAAVLLREAEEDVRRLRNRRTRSAKKPREGEVPEEGRLSPEARGSGRADEGPRHA